MFVFANAPAWLNQANITDCEKVWETRLYYSKKSNLWTLKIRVISQSPYDTPDLEDLRLDVPNRNQKYPPNFKISTRMNRHAPKI